MASRFLHYLVGDSVAKILQIENDERFMVGNLYPDCVSGPGGRKGKKGKSHFVDKVAEEKWEQAVESATEYFCEKYSMHIPEDELYLGYVCHLVADLVWHDEVYVKLKAAYSPIDFSVLSKPLYRDYHRLNEILRKVYDVKYRTLKKIDCDIEEIELELWEGFVLELKNDFEENNGAKTEDLEVLSYEWIKRFVEVAIGRCCEEIREVKDIYCNFHSNYLQ